MNIQIAGACAASFLAGIALTLGYAQANAPITLPGGDDLTVIRIAPSQRQALEAAKTTDRWLDDELLFREALRRGYAFDDLIVRRQLQRRTRLALLQERPPAPASDADLQAWLDAHGDRYSAAPRFSFDQVYLARGARGARLDADAKAVGARLEGDPEGFAKMSDAVTGGPTRKAVTATQVLADFGGTFARALGEGAVGQWQGPIRSPLGAHWLRVTERLPGRRLTLAEARTRVTADFEEERRQQTLRTALDDLRRAYRVVDDPRAVPPSFARVDDHGELP